MLRKVSTSRVTTFKPQFQHLLKYTLQFAQLIPSNKLSGSIKGPDVPYSKLLRRGIERDHECDNKR